MSLPVSLPVSISCQHRKPTIGCAAHRHLSCSGRLMLLSGKKPGAQRPSHTGREQTSSGACFATKEEVSNSQGPSPAFFDRLAEQRALREYLLGRPCTILVLVGPRSSGKTAILKQLFRAEEPSTASVAEISTSFGSYVDGREQPLTDPADLANLLQAQGRDLSARIEKFVKWAALAVAVSAIEGVRFSLEPVGEKMFKSKGQQSPLARVIQAYTNMLRRFRGLKKEDMPWPIIAIDEANVLTAWANGSETQQNDLGTLLRFFVFITKQEQYAHVVLATSDYGFLDWLAQRVGQGFYQVEVIGDFPKEEARAFFLSTAYSQYGQAIQLSDTQWEEIYKVAGGNPGLLIRAAALYKGDWGTIKLQPLWAPMMEDVLSALDMSSSSQHEWEGQQFAELAILILEAEHNAVPVAKAVSCLGVRGRATLEALIRANLIAYRPNSDWARDIPLEAYDDAGRQPASAVVTAPSAAHLYCMQMLMKYGRLQQTASAANKKVEGQADGWLQDEIKGLEQEINLVQEKVAEVELEITALRKEKPTYWREDLEALRVEKQQLRAEKEQLREKERLLLLQNQ